MSWPDSVVLQQQDLVTAVLAGDVDRASLVGMLERVVAAELRVPHVVATSSATSALQSLLLLHAAGPDDEVVVPAYGWISVGGAAWACGARVRVAATGAGLTPRWEDIAAVLSPRTAAVVLAHPNGALARDAERIAAELAAREIPLIQDCAQAWGIRPASQPAGSGLGAVYSLHSAKLVSAEEGGLIAVDDEELAGRLRHLIGDRAVHSAGPSWRLAFRLTWMQAAMALPEIAVLPQRVARLRCLREKMAQVFGSAAIAHSLVGAGRPDNGTHLTVRLSSPEHAARCGDELAAQGITVVLPGPPDDEHQSQSWPTGARRADAWACLLSIRTPLVPEEHDDGWLSRLTEALRNAEADVGCSASDQASA